MSWLRFTNPWLLTLLPVAIGAVATIVVRRGHAVRRKVWAVVLRSMIVSCIVLAAAGVEFNVPGEGICRIFVVDASTSASAALGDALGAVRRCVDRMRPGDLAGLIVMAEQPAVEIAPADAGGLEIPREIQSQISPDGTDLAAAVRLACNTFPDGPHKQLVLMWDGNAPGADIVSTASAIAGRNVEFVAVPTGPRDVKDARIEALRIPERVRAGRKVTAEVTVAATSPTTVSVEVSSDGRVRAGPRRMRIGPEKPARMLAELDLADGRHEVVARIVEPQDAFAANDSIVRHLRVGGRPPVLLVSSVSDPWLGKLLQANPNLDAVVRTSNGLPSLSRFDCVILDDVPVWQLDDDDQQALCSYAEAGGGLVVLGGRRAFGPGGYVGSRIEEVLPVSCDPRRRESKPIAVALVLDKSGSMAEKVAARPKIDYSRLGVLRAVDELKPEDFVTLIAFDSSAREILPLTAVKNATGLRRLVGRIFAGGQTDLNPPLQAAWNVLKDRPDGVGHVLLLSDGLSDTQVDADAVATKMKASGITLSAVATGDDADMVLLERLARTTGGRFYTVDDIRRLPEVFSSEIRLRSGRLIVEGNADVRIVREGGPLGGLAELPDINGYVLTAPKEEATVHAVVAEKGDALVSSWSVGLGRVAVFTSTPGGDWAAPWQRWPDRGKFWNQIVRWTARPVDSGKLHVDLSRRGGSLHISAELSEGVAAPEGGLTARVSTSSEAAIEVPLRRVGVRSFSGTCRVEDQGACFVTVLARETPQLRASRTLQPDYSDEWRAVGLNEPELRRLATAARGTVVDDLAGWGAGPGSGRQWKPIGWLLLLAAVGIFLFDLAIT